MPTTLVSRRETFNAAHVLSNPELDDAENARLYGKCVNIHGHNYTIEVAIQGEIDPRTGYIYDLKQLSDLIGREIIQHVDHRNLNTDVTWLAGVLPTTEALARIFWERLEPHLPAGSLCFVRLYETDKNWAECRSA